MIVATHEDSAAVAKSEREGFERALDSEVSVRPFADPVGASRLRHALWTHFVRVTGR